jgi:hypothetical protein
MQRAKKKDRKDGHKITEKEHFGHGGVLRESGRG